MAFSKSKKASRKGGSSKASKHEKHHPSSEPGSNSGSFPFYNDDKKRLYVLGILPLALLVLGSIVSSTLAPSIRASNSGNKSPLQILFDAVIEAGRKTIFYERDFAFYIQNRKMVARRNIRKGSLILDLPRDAQLWHTEALADPFIRQELFAAKHAASGNLVSQRAYLAAFVALLTSDKDNDLTNLPMTRMDPKVLSAYLDYLPKEADYASHPVLQGNDYLARTFGEHSLTYSLIRRRQMEWESEYHGFCQMSKAFAARVPRIQDYLVARIHIASRSFSASAAGLDSDSTIAGIPQDDMAMYSKTLGYDYQKDGFVVMAPVLDALDHSMRFSNVDKHYNPDSKSFTLVATRDIPAGTELVTTYGGKVDPWLYANYGFVNTDGSGPLGASLAAFHTIYHDVVSIPNESSDGGSDKKEFQMAQRKDELLRYLQYDDGMDHCIGAQQEDTNMLEFKRMKLELLESIANRPELWMISLPPRTLLRQEGDSYIPYFAPTVSATIEQEDGLKWILSTCRLLALLPTDYQGRASGIVEGLVQRLHSGDDMFRMIPGEPSLEYRARVWLKRLAMAKLEHYKVNPLLGSTAAEEIEHLMNITSAGMSTWERMESHVRLGELQALELLIDFANAYLRQGGSNIDHTTIRDEPCPQDLSEYLLNV